MKVALVTKSFSRSAGGLLEAMRRPAQLLAGRFQVDVTVLGLEDRYTREDSVQWSPIKTTAFPVKGPCSLGFSPGLGQAMRSTVFDTVHTHGLFCYPSIAVSNWAAQQQRPYLVTPHGMLDPWALNNSRWKKKVFSLLFENKHLHNAGCIQALCTSEARSIRQYGLTNPICRIPNGIDLPADGEKKPEAPWNGLVQHGQKVLLFLGRIHPKKGLVNLLSAWSKLQHNAAANNEWVLVIVGWDQGGHEKELKQQVQELGIVNSILFLGPQFNDDKLACYQNADAFILPSYSEGLPMVVLEAWAHKLPVLMTPQCNIPEGFQAGAAIEIQTTVVDIERRLQDFFSLSGEERQTVGEKGFILVSEKFTWEKVTEELHRVYLWLVDGGAPPSSVEMV